MKSISDVAYVSAPVIKWARERAGLSSEELAVHLQKVSASQVSAWERGQACPTFSQAEKLAEKLQLPFAVLFMDEPPEIKLPIPDLRTVAQTPRQKPTLEFFDGVSDALIRQRWYREYQEARDALSLSFVGSFRPGDGANLVAEDMARRLGIDDELRNECSTWQEFFVSCVKRAEHLGVLVMRSGVVRHNANRTLRVEEFRGFAISDKLAPLVFINSRDAKAAQVFTLAHELVHIWIGASGVSNPKPKKRATELPHGIEQFCNQVAAQLLVPASGLEAIWTDKRHVAENVRAVATYYRVSGMVALMRAYSLDKLGHKLFSQLMDAEYRRLKQPKKENDEGGGNFWGTFSARNSPSFVKAVTTTLREDRLTYRDAANLLGISVGTLRNYATSRFGR